MEYWRAFRLVGHTANPWPEVAFLKKPFTLDVLARKVREVLDRP